MTSGKSEAIMSNWKTDDLALRIVTRRRCRGKPVCLLQLETVQPGGVSRVMRHCRAKADATVQSVQPGISRSQARPQIGRTACIEFSLSSAYGGPPAPRKAGQRDIVGSKPSSLEIGDRKFVEDRLYS